MFVTTIEWTFLPSLKAGALGESAAVGFNPRYKAFSLNLRRPSPMFIGGGPDETP